MNLKTSLQITSFWNMSHKNQWIKLIEKRKTTENQYNGVLIG